MRWVNLLLPPLHQFYRYSISLDAVTLWRGQSILTFAYYSPSITDDDLTLLLNNLPKSTLFIADFNITFTKQSSRKTVLMKHMNKHSLIQIEPSNGISKLDHCFAHPSIPTSCEMHHQYLLPIRTDHPALIVDIDLPEPVPPSPDSNTYNLSLLKRSDSCEGTKRFLLHLYRELSPDISRQLQWLCRQVEELPN